MVVRRRRIQAVIQINASKGLGDAIYLRVIAAHLREQGEEVCVFTSWPEVFDGLDVRLRPLAELKPDISDRQAFYCLFCRIKAVRVMDQFSIACAQAGIDEPIPLRLRWTPKNVPLLTRIKQAAGNKKILVYQPPKLASNEDHATIRPDIDAFLSRLDSFADWFRVKIGSPRFVQACESPCELDLFGKTTVSDALDVCTIGDMAYSDESYLRIVFEALDKPFVVMYSRRVMASPNPRVRNVLPERTINKRHLATAVFDDE